MNTRNSVIGAAMFLGLLAAAAPALAKRPAAAHDSRDSQELIQVQAPHDVQQESLREGKVDAVSLTASVSYGDLDLQEDAGAKELEHRIHAAANEVCTKLDRMYPKGELVPDDCAGKAVNQAMIQARAVIDEARSARG